ncbi:MAG: quinoprotein relay system zinc metallohydrolase 2 [Geminicoccaceae bacterium]|nr:quinoprotein relay system zinc metallohydrolase 2 [Geminicoccaceae bacterium]
MATRRRAIGAALLGLGGGLGGARRFALAQGALPLVEAAPGVFVHHGLNEDFTPENLGGIANIGFVVGKEGVAVVDPGGSRLEGEMLLAAIRGRTKLPVTHVVLTHLHPDHVFGTAAFEGLPGVRFVGHENLPNALQERGPAYLANMRTLLGDAAKGTEIVLPDTLVGDRMTIDLGGRVLGLRAWPTAHTNTDLTVQDEGGGLLFAGDLVSLERLPVVDGSLNGWLAVLPELAAIPAKAVVPGHGPVTAPWPDALEPERAYLEALRDGLRRAIADGVPIEGAIKAVPMPVGGTWQLADETHPRNVMAGYTELEWE